MSTKTIDYEALAKQYGAVSSAPAAVDYAALAKANGAISSTPASVPPPQARTWLDTAKDVGIGALKSAGSTAQDIMTVMRGGVPVRLPESITPEQYPQGTAQKVGAGVEQAGEMMLTGGPLREGATVLASKLPAWAAKAAPIVARIGAEGVNTGANAALHGENPVPAAGAGVVGGAVGEALSPMVAPLRKAAVSQYQKFLNPTTKATKAMADKITPELIDRGVVATSGDALEKRAAGQVDQLGQDINQAVANVPANVKPNAKSVLSDLEKYKQSFIVNGTPIDGTAVKNVEQLQQTISDLGPDVSYQSLNRVRQILDAKPAKAGAFAGKVLADGTDLDVQKEAANAIRRELAKQSPDIAKINGEFHFWKQVEDVIGATNERRVGQQGGLTRAIVGGAGAAGGFAHGGSAEAALWGVGMFAAHQAITSPTWRTVSPIIKDRLADAIASGSAKKMLSIATEIGAGQVAASTPATSQ